MSPETNPAAFLCSQQDSNQRPLIQKCAELTEWSKTWQLDLSLSSKCFALYLGYSNPHTPYSVDNIIIESMDNCRDLGVIIDSGLSFSKHCDLIASKAMQRIKLIFRIFRSKHRKNLIRAYLTYIRPLLEYATCVWSPRYKRDIATVEKVQAYFTRRLYGYVTWEQHPGYPSRLASSNLESLELRRLRIDLEMVYKMMCGTVDLKLDEFFTKKTDSLYNLRGHDRQFYPEVGGLEIRRHFFSNRIVSIWNDLPYEVVHASSLYNFKKSLLNVNLTQYLCK